MDTTGNIAYITEQNAGRLVQLKLNPASPDYGRITPIAVGLGGPRGLALNQSGKLVYLAEESSTELSVVNVDPGSPGYGSATPILSGQGLRDIALKADERQAVVRDADEGILVVDIAPASPVYGRIIHRATPVPLDGARGLWVNSSQSAPTLCPFIRLFEPRGH